MNYADELLKEHNLYIPSPLALLAHHWHYNFGLKGALLRNEAHVLMKYLMGYSPTCSTNQIFLIPRKVNLNKDAKLKPHHGS